MRWRLREAIQEGRVQAELKWTQAILKSSLCISSLQEGSECLVHGSPETFNEWINGGWVWGTGLLLQGVPRGPSVGKAEETEVPGVKELPKLTALVPVLGADLGAGDGGRWAGPGTDSQ